MAERRRSIPVVVLVDRRAVAKESKLRVAEDSAYIELRQRRAYAAKHDLLGTRVTNDESHNQRLLSGADGCPNRQVHHARRRNASTNRVVGTVGDI
jgi:hypothetical protein